MTLQCVMLTPGTGNFHCGSCLRDHSLAIALEKEGVEVTMIPLYMPHVAEDDFNTAPLFFGGLNVFLQSSIPLFKKTPLWLDRLFDHPLILKCLSRFAGWTTASTLGKMTLSTLNIEQSGQFKEFDKMLNWMNDNIKPDVIILSNGLLAGFVTEIKKRFKAKVWLTLQGEDSFIDSLCEPYRSESWTSLAEKINHFDLVIPVSDTHLKIMRERLQVDVNKMVRVYNGIDLDGLPKPLDTKENFLISFLANIIPGKGLMTLVDAFILIKKNPLNHDIKLMVLGSVTPFTANYLEEVKNKLKLAKLEQECEFHINLSREDKFRYLNKASILAVPATYGESFGLYLLEALALGIPFVQPDHGSFRELLGVLQGGVLCKPDDAVDLSLKIVELYQNPAELKKLGEVGKKNVEEFFSKEVMAKQIKALMIKQYD